MTFSPDGNPDDEISAYIDWQPRWSNCVFWGIRQLARHGGYGLIRRGHNGVPFHMLWSPDHRQVYSYEPLVPQWSRRNWQSDLLVLFRGYVCPHDEPPSLRALYPLDSEKDL